MSRRARIIALGAVVALLVALAFLFVPELAWARPGGGQTFGGGGSGGGGGGGGGDGGLVYILIWLCIEHPYIGIPLTLGVIVFYVMKGRRGSRRQNETWDSAPPRPTPVGPVSLQPLRQIDPDFSRVLFEDFVFKLYAQAHRVRHDIEALAALAPYLSSTTRTGLHQRSGTGPVQGVVVGAMTPVRFQMPAPQPGQEAEQFARVHLAFTANITAGQHTYFVKELWVLKRALSARSRPPESIDSLHCPSCGAPFESGDDVHCNHCKQAVTGGQFDWHVESAMLTAREARPPTLTGHAPEHGTHFPTITDPGYAAARASLAGDDPQYSEEAIAKRLTAIYTVLNESWSNRNLTPARPYVSDSMYHYLGYWISAYRRQQLRNLLEDMRLTNWVPVKLVRDKYYDALTVRIWGTGKDSTIHLPTQRVVGGSRTVERPYSEYWTLIRAAGAHGAARADANCPNCAAPLKVNMAGACDYCGAHLTRGEFDWVLSKIEQDEVYRG